MQQAPQLSVSAYDIFNTLIYLNIKVHVRHISEYTRGRCRAATFHLRWLPSCDNVTTLSHGRTCPCWMLGLTGVHCGHTKASLLVSFGEALSLKIAAVMHIP